MVPSRAMAKALGEAIVKKHAALLEQDVSVARVHEAHETVKRCLEAVSPDLQLFTFGSSAVYGFHERNSDVDFVALRPEDVQDGKGGDCTTQLAKALQTELLAKLTRELKAKNFSWALEEVRRARVPVVKVKTPTVDFDITAHRRNGVRNSALLRAYFEQRPQDRWLSVAIKSWSKDTGMNGAMGYLTSYGFNLMVCYYLVHGSKTEQWSALSPRPTASVTRDIASVLPPPLTFVNKDALDVTSIAPIPGYLPLLPPDTETVGAQVLDFLDFYLNRFPMDTAVITLSTPSLVQPADLNWTKTAEDLKRAVQEKVFYRVCIEDPFEVNLNVGRNISSFKLDMMKKHFEKGLKTGLGLLLQ